MRPVRTALAAGAALVLAWVGLEAGLGVDVAGAQTARMSVRPTVVGAGGTVDVASVDPCPPPANTPGADPFVRVTITRGRSVLGSATSKVGTDGAWAAALRVRSTATSGAATVDAFCIFNQQAEGAYEAYAPVSVRVRGRAAAVSASASAPGLARTGPSTAPLSATGAALVLVGLALVLSSRPARDQSTPTPGTAGWSSSSPVSSSSMSLYPHSSANWPWPSSGPVAISSSSARSTTSRRGR
ncbi:MAG: hypothetical protein QOK43_2463 [Acidimicrobiaceae bacterium]|nr:hypothetical protein [Acidimicrobiaceae bacterium]MDQ1445427.1 hypothetical protein [Acidimicrobiaceae bacterium]